MPTTQATPAKTSPTNNKKKKPAETQPTAASQPKAPGPDQALSAEERIVEQSIQSLETLYQALTGSAPPATGDGSPTPIPVEREPGAYVSERLDQLCRAVESRFRTPLQNPPWSPAASAWENDREIVVCVDLPGVSRDEVDVDLQGRLLTVSGRRPPELRDHQRRMADGPRGPFERTFALPARAAEGAVEASLRDGVMQLRVPKLEAETESRRRIPVG